jgi:predicted nucleic acid-binding protein
MTSAAEPPSDPHLRAVLDTSVLISEHRHWLWDFARRGYYEARWSTYIIGELVRVRVEHSIRHGVQRAMYRQRINHLIHLLTDVLIIADYRTVPLAGVLRDPDDEPILAAAIASGAAFVVSLNTRDFPSGNEVLGVRFLTPRAFLAELTTRNPGAIVQQAADTGRLLP